MPLEGGLYQWARLGLGELMGFHGRVESVDLRGGVDRDDRAAVVGTNLSYVVGPGGAWMASNKLFIIAAERLPARRGSSCLPRSGLASASGCTTSAALC